DRVPHRHREAGLDLPHEAAVGTVNDVAEERPPRIHRRLDVADTETGADRPGQARPTERNVIVEVEEQRADREPAGRRCTGKGAPETTVLGIAELGLCAEIAPLVAERGNAER